MKWVQWVSSETELVSIKYRNSHFEIVVPKGTLHTRTNEFEPSGKDGFTQIVSPESTVYDIGARAGVYCGIAHDIGVPLRKIHAFEANCFWSHVLDYNYGRDGAHITCEFVGDGCSGISIDDYVQSNEAPSVVKIDVEGAEMSVLKGMQKTVQKFRPELLVEVHTSFGKGPSLEDFGDSVESFLSLLREMGYDLKFHQHRSRKLSWTVDLNKRLAESSNFQVLALQ